MPSALVIGAGVFGVWTARALRDRDWRVTLVDQYGPGNSRSSSGGETRILRSGYGDAGVYARWAHESRPEWLALERRAGERLFVATGALFLGRDGAWLRAAFDGLRALPADAEWLDAEALARRFPQLHFPDTAGAVLETGAGVLFARRAVQALARQLAADGADVVHRWADPYSEIRDRRADALVFACGPWLPHLFPEVLFFGSPSGDGRFSPPDLPAWVAFDEGIYGLPDLECRGVKIAVDAHGPPADPDRLERIVTEAAVQRIREALRRRLPGLGDAPLLETRVCQYENSADGHFILDRLPGHDAVWVAGGGSGHGFKHGPAVGRYMADLVEGRTPGNPLFGLTGRATRRRTVF
jgi:glycine/D-amino acid oxidase-like deaminating enzyme